MDNSNRPEIRAYIGATGSGKGVSVRSALKKENPSRCMIWDRMKEHEGFAKLYMPHQFPEFLMALKKPAFRVAYYPGDDKENQEKYEERFAWFCRAAKAQGNLTMLVEELADLTKPQFSPAEWKSVCIQGRHYALRVWATTQRPAQVDKDFLGNTSLIRCMTLRTRSDKKTMADFLDVEYKDIAELQTIESEDKKKTTIMYIERDFRIGKTTKDTITLTR